MKALKIFLVALYAFIYGYSVYKTGVEPERPVWGWICALVFLISCIWLISEHIKNEYGNNSNG